MKLAAGRSGIAIRSVEDPSYFIKQKKIRDEIESILSCKDIPSALALTERVAKDKEMLKTAADFLIRSLRDNIIATILESKTYHTKVGRLKEIHRILSIIESTNVNPRLAMDVMLMEALTTNSTNSFVYGFRL